MLIQPEEGNDKYDKRDAGGDTYVTHTYDPFTCSGDMVYMCDMHAVKSR